MQQFAARSTRMRQRPTRRSPARPSCAAVQHFAGRPKTVGVIPRLGRAPDQAVAYILVPATCVPRDLAGRSRSEGQTKIRKAAGRPLSGHGPRSARSRERPSILAGRAAFCWTSRDGATRLVRRRRCLPMAPPGRSAGWTSPSGPPQAPRYDPGCCRRTEGIGLSTLIRFYPDPPPSSRQRLGRSSRPTPSASAIRLGLIDRVSDLRVRILRDGLMFDSRRGTP